MILYLLLIGLVTAISIFIYIKINKRLAAYNIIGIAIIFLAGIFAGCIIAYPTFMGGYRELVISFVVAFILLIGIYVVAYMIANKHVEKDSNVSAERSAEVKESKKTVQVKNVILDTKTQRRAKKRAGKVSAAGNLSSSVKKAKVIEKTVSFSAAESISAERVDSVIPVEPTEERTKSEQDEVLNIFADLSKNDESGEILEEQTADEQSAINDEPIVGVERIESTEESKESEQEAVGILSEQLESTELAEQLKDQEAVEQIAINDESIAGVEPIESTEESKEGEQEAVGIFGKQLESTELAEQLEEQASAEQIAVHDDQQESIETIESADESKEGEQEAVATFSERPDRDDLVEIAEDQAQTERDNKPIAAKQISRSVYEDKENKNSKIISKSIELMDQGKYIYAIFVLQSALDDVHNKALEKQVDFLLMECLIFSNQLNEGQKKWFDIVNKKYDLNFDDRIKLKETMVQLKAMRQ